MCTPVESMAENHTITDKTMLQYHTPKLKLSYIDMGPHAAQLASQAH